MNDNRQLERFIFNRITSSKPKPQNKTKMAPVTFEYHEQAQKTFKPPLIANENAFLGDVFTSESNDPQAPISAGFYRLEKGK